MSFLQKTSKMHELLQKQLSLAKTPENVEIFGSFCKFLVEFLQKYDIIKLLRGSAQIYDYHK